MQIRALSDGNVTSTTGSGTNTVSSGHIGAVYLQANSTNTMTLVLRIGDSSGKIIFDQTLTASAAGPFTKLYAFTSPLSLEGDTTVHWTLTSGVGVSEAMLYEWIN